MVNYLSLAMLDNNCIKKVVKTDDTVAILCLGCPVV